MEPRRASTECTGDGDGGWWDHGLDIRRRVGCGARQAAMQRGSTLSLHGWRPRLGTGDEWARSGIGAANAWRRRWGCCQDARAAAAGLLIRDFFFSFFWVRLGRIQIRGVRVAPSSVFSAIRHVLDGHRQGSPFADT